MFQSPVHMHTMWLCLPAQISRDLSPAYRQMMFNVEASSDAIRMQKTATYFIVTSKSTVNLDGLPILAFPYSSAATTVRMPRGWP